MTQTTETTTRAGGQPFDIERTLAALTLEEKAGLTSGHDFWNTKTVRRPGDQGQDEGQDAVLVPGVMVTDGPHGLRKQRADADHLGIGDSVPATCFPPAVGLGSTWDPTLLRRVGEALGRETAANDVAVLLGPGINIKRSPCAGATSSTCPRTRSSRATSAPRSSRASSPRASAPR
ncbi:hypothetical protein GCM10025865_09030 [Paraoerskovia sediminicola]|uniref:Glycoside hydrolase family 3 N-terminal domain-containing protein n=1 Tax=Paraoerskovia sediminicola TaxID=1138587 RepID=A0ABM8G0W0_9CELL|nr:hypothetical protein GCM10025865_09030 [Paraoerskovia sediminicola]